MRTVKHLATWWPLMAIAFFVAVPFSCKKDAPFTNPIIEKASNFSIFNWSADENDFFSLENRTIGIVQSRSNDNSSIFHPLLIEAYNELAIRNEATPYVEQLVSKAGLPIWRKAFVNHNTATNQSLVLIPLARKNETKISSVIALRKHPNEHGGKFVPSGFSRETILNHAVGNAWEKGAKAGWISKFDKMIFKTRDSLIENARCQYEGRKPTDPKPTPGPVPPGPNPSTPIVPCDWRIIELCWDDETQTSFIGGTGIYPIHLDHDMDGVLNMEDPEFIEMAQNAGKQPQEFQEELYDFILDWWGDHPEYGDYDDFWDELEGGQVVDGDFWEAVGEVLRDIGEAIGEGFGDFGDWIGDLFREGVDCPNWPPLDGVLDRDIQCGDYYYAKVCDDGVGNWWDDIVTTVQCDGCQNYQDYQDYLRDRLYKHYEKVYEGEVEFEHLLNLAIANGCDPFSPIGVFESCADETFTNDYFSCSGDLNVITLPSGFDNCFGASCTTCTYKG